MAGKTEILPTSERRRLVAELAVLDRYDLHRRTAGHDYGAGQRVAELRRRGRVLRDRYGMQGSLSSHELAAQVTGAELLAAFERVGRPRWERVQADEARFFPRGETPASTRTRRVWARVERWVRDEARAAS